jgi:GT2 family glycosyltransferase
MQVSVVDNASTDGTAEMVRDEFPEVKLYALDWNSGFTVGNNIALREARAPFVLVLNPDTEVYEGALDHMLAVMRERPDIGMSSCRLARPDGTLDHAAKRSFPTPIGALAHFVGIGRRENSPKWLAQYRAFELGEYEAGDVDSVNGAFMLVRREALEQVGLFDERYWIYMEDLDWCYRFWQAGWPVLYWPGAEVVHVKGGSATKNRSWRANRAFHRGMWLFYRKHYLRERSPLVTGLVWLAVWGKLGLSALRSLAARRWRAHAG